MATEFIAALARSYHLAQVMGDRTAALTYLKGAISGDTLDEAKAKRAQLSMLLAKHPGRCHVSKVQLALLDAALKPGIDSPVMR